MRTDRTQPIPVVVGAAAASLPTQAPRNTTAPVSLRADLDHAETDPWKSTGALALVSLAAQVYAWRRRPSTPRAHGRSKAALDKALVELRSGSLLEGTKERAAAQISGALEGVFGARAEWPSDDTGDTLRSLSEDLEFLRFAPQLGSYDAKLKEVRDRALALLEGLQ
jgi:hypothetical protein